MSDFIELTDAHTQTKIRIRFTEIISYKNCDSRYGTHPDCRVVYTIDGFKFKVLDTIQFLDKKIKQHEDSLYEKIRELELELGKSYD